MIAFFVLIAICILAWIGVDVRSFWSALPTLIGKLRIPVEVGQ